MPSANEIRKTFLEYFEEHGHEVAPSSPLVPHNDPTLLFTNAGMVQFKNVFTGIEQRPYRRATTSQKCVRAGGKHNDLDNVGYTARHHTFFEMLGNFSFGDYFKDVAIELAWNLVTKEYGLAADRLLTTVYAEDDEAFALWKKIAGLPESRILRIPTSDNFWAMGDTGPCGPCSEIFYDHGPEVPGGPPGSPDEDGDRYIEIWNLVFMQFEQIAPGQREPLPRPSIDTGMGLERIAAVLQGLHDNYDIDLFRRIIQASEELTGTRAAGAQRPSHKVIADHLRACSFLIADGVMPSNEGRGYVLRRIMRRAMRHAHMLGAREPLMWRLVPVLVAEMGQAFPELVRAEPLITEVLRLEETRFRDTLERGLRLLEEATADLGAGAELPGATAFRLYDTYGFPLDLTQDALRARGMTVDLAGFDAAMERQRAEARASWKGSGEQAEERIWFELRETLGATEFLGYEHETAEAQVKALVVGGAPAQRAEPGADVMVVTNQTPFYGEAGGQIGDTGTIRRGPAVVRVTDTQKKLGDLHVHVGRLEGGALEVGDVVEMAIDGERRARLRRAHSATHLLHAALRRQLGSHVTQKGSLVAPDRLRFDFSHPKRSDAGRARRDRGRGQRVAAPERCGRDPADGSRCGDRGRRHGVVRREVRRRGAGRVDGARARRPDHLDRAVRWHPLRAHRRHRAVQDHRRVRGGCRHPTDRGADRRGRVPARARRGAAAGRDRRRAQGGAAGSARARGQPDDRAAPARAGDFEAAPAAGDRRRRQGSRSQGHRRHPVPGARGRGRSGQGPARDSRCHAARAGLGRRGGGQRGRRQGEPGRLGVR